MSVESLKSIPFVDFYRELQISPVSQDISDLERHYKRRESLYRLLGLVPKFVRGLDVLELCPGSGHNSLYTQSLSPKSYTLVDANETGLSEAKNLFAQYHPHAENVAFELSLIDDFIPTRNFDIVLCEGAIPLQIDPTAFTRGLTRFVDKQGVLVITTADAVSLLGECIRRLIAARIAPTTMPAIERLAALRPIFATHLMSLSGASRPIDDWILDNIIQPFIGKPFSVLEAIEALATEDFEAYGSSPRFATEWRWYKDMVGQKAQWNARMAEAYLENVLNFLDYRFIRPRHDPDFGLHLTLLCDNFFAELQRLDEPDSLGIERAVDCLETIASYIAKAAPETAESFQEVIRVMHCKTVTQDSFPTFSTFFGRGQQYLSFIRTE